MSILNFQGRNFGTNTEYEVLGFCKGNLFSKDSKGNITKNRNKIISFLCFRGLSKTPQRPITTHSHELQGGQLTKLRVEDLPKRQREMRKIQRER